MSKIHTKIKFGIQKLRLLKIYHTPNIVKNLTQKSVLNLVIYGIIKIKSLKKGGNKK